MVESSPQTPGTNPVARSRITNGSTLLPDIDGRSKAARRFKDVAFAIVEDMGGEDCVSEGQRQLIRRAAGLSVVLEQREAALVNGDDIDSEEWVRLTNVLVRVLSVLGLRRRARKIPSLREILRGSG